MPPDVKDMARLWDMLDAARTAVEFTKGVGFEYFLKDRKTRNAVERNLEIIGEAAKNLPEEFKAMSGDIEWRKIVALRNLLIHEYFGVSKPVVWDIVQNKLDPLDKSCSLLLNP